MIKIITGCGPQIPIDNAKEFNINEDTMVVCPENGLHPYNFQTYVERTCKKAENEDICIFTHNAMLIEFFEVFSTYYEVECEFYLNNEDGCLPYERGELYNIYDYLAKPYDIINIYHIKVRRGQRKKDKECQCCLL